MPVPAMLARKRFDSPVPTHTIEGFDGATATSPMLALASCSKMGRHVRPRFADFHTPPVAAPT